MVEKQIKSRGVMDPAVLAAMRKIPREKFVLEDLVPEAYNDSPLPIEEGQTISQPYMVALMTQALELKPGSRVLEVGAGSGYAAAVLGQIAAEVYSIEYFPKLAELAQSRLQELGYTNVHIKQGDGALGWKEHAPYQGISITAAATKIPSTLLEQLSIGGKLVMPLALAPFAQELVCITKQNETEYAYAKLGGVMFVPLLGKN
ncbi:MAG: protein-L-isoaspartate(D-aspartate) O-methyltransferase [Verrucomicrobia bacterium]|nr:protein-L-isoaspartate(D-aspartate) O-methyltransferase [Verrucomicrobiota bacterium]